MEFREGQFILTKENLIFEVKGNIHPKDRVLAYLRYIPKNTGSRINKENKNYEKIYDLSRRSQYLQQNYPQYLWKDPVSGRIQQSVLREWIVKTYDPVNFLKKLRVRCNSGLQEASVELASKIVDACNISWSDIGITGSQLVSLDIDASDIDLIIYGEKTARQVYSKLLQIRNDIGLRQYTEIRLKQHVDFRWPGITGNWKNSLTQIEKKKVFQGIFNDYDFFIRAVKKPTEIGYKYGDIYFRKLGRITTRCLVTSDEDSIFTPCSYLVHCNSEPELKVLVSFRGRFTEQVCKGMEVIVSGRLETVLDSRTEETYLQIVLGENQEDLLFPIK